MSKAPAMPMYWDAYLADTTHLTIEEHGAYLLLLGAMWRRDGRVPDDDRDNARILRITPSRWRKIKARLVETVAGFQVANGYIEHQKLKKTWENTQKIIEKNRINGAKGGRPKSNKTNAIAKPNGYVSDTPNESMPEPEPTVERDKSLSRDLAQEALGLWNDYASRHGWPVVKTFSANRRTALNARLKEAGIEGWREALDKAAASSFVAGGTFFTFDFLSGPKNFAKVIDGNYDDRAPKKTGPEGPADWERLAANMPQYD